jgi:hypothetical protein
MSEPQAIGAGATLRLAEKELPLIAVRWRLILGVLILPAACTTQAPTPSPTSPPPVAASNASVTLLPIGSGKTLPVVSSTAVAWIPTAAPPLASQLAPVGLEPCRAQDLSISLSGMEGATGGQMAGVLDFRNTSTRSCTLQGHPTVTLSGASGAPLSVNESQSDARFSPERPRPGTWPVLLLRPRDQVESFVVTSNWCGPRAAGWRVGLPDGTSTTLARGFAMGTCENASSVSGLSVGRFEPPQQKPRWPFLPIIFGFPLHANSEGTLSYVVILMNVPPNGTPSKTATQAGSFTFHLPCPSYMERLTQGRRLVATERYVLNCAVVGTILGNVAVQFAMQMRVPLGVVGKAKLTWTLDPPFGFSRTVPVMISL